MQVVPIQRFEEVVVEHGVGILRGIMAQTSHSDSPAPNSGFSAVGEIRLMPDLSTKIALPWYVVFLFNFISLFQLLGKYA
jgi:hypothetical protein